MIDGPQWYRWRIRRSGPFVALILPAIVGIGGVALLRLSDAPWSGAAGLLGSVMGAPGLLVVGAPFGDRGMYPLAVLASAVLWLLVGFVASQRATRNPLATWSDYWRHCLPMTIGIWAGAAAGLGIAALVVGEGVL